MLPRGYFCSSLFRKICSMQLAFHLMLQQFFLRDELSHAKMAYIGPVRFWLAALWFDFFANGCLCKWVYRSKSRLLGPPR